MALMSEERRKEMEEEMSRFELEIAVPGETKSAPSNASIPSKPMSPPPPPPAVTALIPEVLAKAPPPPPPPLSPPLQGPLRPPPHLPALPTQPTGASSVRFIPPQLHRQAPRPPARPNFIGMRATPPMTGPPGHFPLPGSMSPFGGPMGQVHPMGGPPVPQVGSIAPSGPMHPGGHMHSGGPMHGGGAMMPMPPGAMSMASCPPMPHPMGNMNMGVSLPMPPGFLPPGPPMAPPGNMRYESQTFTSSNSTQGSNSEVSVTSPANTSGSSSVVASAPTIYAAPFMKSHPENISENSSLNSQENVTTVSSHIVQKSDTTSVSKSSQEHSVGPTVPQVPNNEETVVVKKKEKKKKIVRMAGGQAWEDNSLLDWDTDDFRIFCGDLGNDVTDEVLIRAFSKYTSFVKAKVIRDKRTNKTKGFGFVSFKDPQDFIKAMREMNGRYVGSRPIKLRKSTWRDRNIDLVKKKQREKEKLGLL